MYNVELKNEYISTHCTKDVQVRMHTLLFNASEEIESRIGKDLYEFNKDEMAELLNTVLGIRKQGRYTRVRIINSYRDWCKNVKNITNVNEFVVDTKSVDVSDKLKDSMVSNPTHLQMSMDKVFEPVENNTMQNTYRCYLWLAYAGMYEEDIVNVKTSDVSIEDMVVNYNGKEYIIYREAKDSFISVLGNSFNIVKSNYTLIQDRGKGDLLLRGFADDISLNIVHTGISRIVRRKSHSVGSLTYKKVWISGLFYRTREAEHAGIPVDFRPVITEGFIRRGIVIPTKRGEDPETVKRIATSNFNYKTDYEAWKKIFP